MGNGGSHHSSHPVKTTTVVHSVPTVIKTSTYNNQNGQHNIDLSGTYNDGTGTNTMIGNGFDHYNNQNGQANIKIGNVVDKSHGG